MSAGISTSSVAGRWLRFNFVGFLGMAVQFAVLAGLAQGFEMHYGVATILAVEAAVLHNFVWHMGWTWRDHAGGWSVAGLGRRFTAFHVTNGLVSLIGNAALMKLLHEMLRMPLLVANGAAIVTCSLINFLLSEAIVFRGKYEER